MFLSKERGKQIRKGDFIPGGKVVDINTLKFRKTKDFEVFQCCVRTNYDPQSGPIYCGDIAEFVARTENGYVYLCERHKPSDDQISG